MVPNLTLIEVSNSPFLSLVTCSQRGIQAKKFVESLPQILKENLSKEDAEKLQKTFTDLGAVVKLE